MWMRDWHAASTRSVSLLAAFTSCSSSRPCSGIPASPADYHIIRCQCPCLIKAAHCHLHQSSAHQRLKRCMICCSCQPYSDNPASPHSTMSSRCQGPYFVKAAHAHLSQSQVSFAAACPRRAGVCKAQGSYMSGRSRLFCLDGWLGGRAMHVWPANAVHKGNDGLDAQASCVGGRIIAPCQREGCGRALCRTQPCARAPAERH